MHGFRVEDKVKSFETNYAYFLGFGAADPNCSRIARPGRIFDGCVPNA